MLNGNRRLVLNWSPAHDDLKRSAEEGLDPEAAAPGNGRGWTYLTFYPRGTNAGEVLFDIDRLGELARENHYHLPQEVVAQHNKVVLTAYAEGDPPLSPLWGLFSRVTAFADRFSDPHRYPSHGVYGKFGGIYERPEKGRVLAIYSRNAEALLTIYESIEKLLSETRLEGFRFELDFSNGLSAIPRMLEGFDNPDYRQAGALHYRIADPARFMALLEQAREDYRMYRFEEPPPPGRLPRSGR
jgi:hypothetical protein